MVYELNMLHRRSRRRRCLATCALFASLLACSDPVVSRTFTTPRSQRPYRVFSLKKGDIQDSPAILFVLHDYGVLPDALVREFALDKRAVESRKWLVVAPEGTRDNLGKRFWNASEASCGETTERPDDLGYLREVLLDVRDRLMLTTDTVYAIGVSNGAFMGYRWACRPERDLTALVAISGAAPGPLDPPCSPGRPVRILHVHGDKDDTVRFLGRKGRDDGYPSARESVETWRRLNHLRDIAPKVAKDRSLLLGSIQKETWYKQGATVALWTVIGAGHKLRWLRSEVPRFLNFLNEPPQ